jgi:hypothetical protein
MASISAFLFPEGAPQQRGVRGKRKAIPSRSFVPFHDRREQHDHLAVRNDRTRYLGETLAQIPYDDDQCGFIHDEAILLWNFDPGPCLSPLHNATFTILRGKPCAQGIDISLTLQSGSLPFTGMRDA